MRTRILLLAAFALTLLVFLSSVEPTRASNAIAEREDLACTSCHDKPGSKLLTDRGKYYEQMGTLVGFDELEARFTRCTSCHVRKPGSLKLTETGRRYRWMMGDMDGIRQWLMERHPRPTETPEGQAP